MWPTAFALTGLTAADEELIGAPGPAGGELSRPAAGWALERVGRRVGGAQRSAASLSQ